MTIQEAKDSAAKKYYTKGDRLLLNWEDAISEYCCGHISELVFEKIIDEAISLYHLSNQPKEVVLDSDMPDLFTDMANQIHYESMIRKQDMGNITECFNKLQEQYKKENASATK